MSISGEVVGSVVAADGKLLGSDVGCSLIIRILLAEDEGDVEMLTVGSRLVVGCALVEG